MPGTERNTNERLNLFLSFLPQQWIQAQEYKLLGKAVLFFFFTNTIFDAQSMRIEEIH